MKPTRSSPFTLALGLALASLGGACGDKDITIPTDAHKGGSITIASCGYAVTTRDRSSAPYGGQPLLGAAPTPTFVHLGFAGDPSTSIAVQWRTDTGTLASTVELTEAGASAPVVTEGFTHDYTSDDYIEVRTHEAHLCGLKPDTEYTYRVGGKDKKTKAEAWSKSYTFRTAPATTQADAELVVLVLGDTRGDYTMWKNTLDRAFQIERPDLILFSGDATTFGTYQDEWDQWFTGAGDHLAEVPLVITHGNHELNAVNYFSQFALPGDEENFAFDYGSVHVTVANDTPTDVGVLTGSTLTFLADDLGKSASRPWRFVMHHRPIWSASLGHGGDEALKAAWLATLDQHRPDIVWNGHEHNYERTKPLRNSQAQTALTDGVTYVIAGSSGAPLYDAGSDFWTAYAEKTNSFVVVKLRNKTLDATAYRPGDGSVLDSFSITKP